MNAPEDADCAPALPSDEWKAMVGMVTQLFGHWHLSCAEQVGLLGLPTADESCLDRFRGGDRSDINRDIEIRIGHLFAIHQLLRTLFPLNRDLAYRWATTPNSSFAKRAPVAVIQEHGMRGLLGVRSYLDKAAAADH